MPVVDIKQMLHHAYENGYAVGAFDLVSLEFLDGIIEAAERCRSPVILSLAESHFDHYHFGRLMAAAERAAGEATVPVALFLDHGASLASAVEAINTGCNGVMVDASHHPLEENIARTREVERHPGEMAYTTVEEAKEYVERTGVDFLAVSVGTVHGRMKGEPQLDFERLGDIDRALRIPLVIHGGTGLGDDQFRRLIENGVAKINYYTCGEAPAGPKRWLLPAPPGLRWNISSSSTSAASATRKRRR